MVDETDISCIESAIPIKVSLHRTELSVELYITSSLSPALHTKAFSGGDSIIAPTKKCNYSCQYSRGAGITK